MNVLKNFLNLIITSITYPQRLAEAVNRAHDKAELDLILNGDSDDVR